MRTIVTALLSLLLLLAAAPAFAAPEPFFKGAWGITPDEVTALYNVAPVQHESSEGFFNGAYILEFPAANMGQSFSELFYCFNKESRNLENVYLGLDLSGLTPEAFAAWIKNAYNVVSGNGPDGRGCLVEMPSKHVMLYTGLWLDSASYTEITTSYTNTLEGVIYHVHFVFSNNNDAAYQENLEAFCN